MIDLMDDDIVDLYDIFRDLYLFMTNGFLLYSKDEKCYVLIFFWIYIWKIELESNVQVAVYLVESNFLTKATKAIARCRDSQSQVYINLFFV